MENPQIQNTTEFVTSIESNAEVADITNTESSFINNSSKKDSESDYSSKQVKIKIEK